MPHLFKKGQSGNPTSELANVIKLVLRVGDV
jgi:hypothetical protein